jgi:hypothetical protein
MSYLSDEIEVAARTLDIPAKQLIASEARAMRLRIAEHFALQSDELLERVRPKGVSSIHDPDIWRRLDELFGHEPLYLLFKFTDDNAIWRIPGGEFLVQILKESVGFAFYAVPESLNFIVYFDDHNCLLGNGRAAQWIERSKISGKE